MENFIEIGIIVKTRGFKGEFVIQTNLDDTRKLEKLTTLKIENKLYCVKQVKFLKDRFSVIVNEINNENEAKTLIGKTAMCIKEEIILIKDEFFLSDFIEMEVFNEQNTYIGRIIETENYGAGDIFTININKKEEIFTNKEGLIISVDLKNKKMIVNSQILSEVLVCE